MAFLEEIAARLVARQVGSLNDEIFLTSRAVIPKGKGPYLSVIETGGGMSDKTQNDTAVARPTAQLVARAMSYVDARALLVAAYNALGGENGLFNVTLSGTKYLKIVARQGPTDGGMDEAGRAKVLFNIEAEKQPS